MISRSWLARPFWGRGIVTEALGAVTRYAVAAHGLVRLYAMPYAWNPASARVLEKLGFTACGTIMWPDNDQEDPYYELLRPGSQ